MPAIITNDLRIKNADVFANDMVKTPNYIYIGKDTAWPDESTPDNLIGSDKELFEAYNNMLALKKIETNSVKSVVQRFDWIRDEIYDAYDHRVNMQSSKTPIVENFYRYYVMTDEFNVYKCISNNNGAKSTEQPTSQQVSTFQTSDGYVWKYMYTIRAGDAMNFLTPGWMPIYSLKYNDGSSQWQVQFTAVDGAIHRIDLTSAGINYDPLDPPAVSITGDGTGAAAIAVVNPENGTLQRIDITNIGQGYSFAEVVIEENDIGVGASAVAILSPVGGHGYDARRELGGTSKMFKVTLSGTEGGTFPLTSFRNVGLIAQPMSENVGSKVFLNNLTGFSSGDTIQGGTSNATAQVMFIDEEVLWAQNVVGNFIVGEALNNITSSSSSNIITVVNSTNLPLNASTASVESVIRRSGRLLYLSNRERIRRTEEQSEDIRLVVTF